MDMLVPLYKLEGVAGRLLTMQDQGIDVRRPMAYERDTVIDWVRRVFEQEAPGWASECKVALSCVPATCHIATHAGKIVGFACFDATARGFFGPTGTAPEVRGKGVGAALLVTALSAMRDAGYAYAVIGGVGEPVQGFYAEVAGAVAIAGSEPGIYRDPLL